MKRLVHPSLRSGATLPPARWNQGGAYEAKKEVEASLAVSAGVQIYYVSKSLGHSGTVITERHYASLAPGAARGLPNVMEQTVRNAAVRFANQMRTEGVEDGTPVLWESVTI